MISRNLLTICCLVHALYVSEVTRASDLTLRSLGAVGDGRSDDRAIIEAALVKAQGSPIDGEGATYAVHGNIEIKADVYFRNATLVQTMTPADISKYIPSAHGKGTLTVAPAEALDAMVGTLPLMQANGIATYSDDSVLTAEELKAVLPSIGAAYPCDFGQQRKTGLRSLGKDQNRAW